MSEKELIARVWHGWGTRATGKHTVSLRLNGGLHAIYVNVWSDTNRV